jgi:short-subunit dehydrogenase
LRIEHDAPDRPVALITGASSGIGETFARRLAARGYDLILVARRGDRLRAIASSVPTHADVLEADLATEDGLGSAAEAIRNCPRLRLLVNNAGFGTLKRFWEADLSGQEAMHRLHVIAAMRLTHEALRAMTRRDRGGIINVSSVAAFSQSEGNASYCATKAWMNSFTLALDMELRGARSKVRVQALCPGFTLSEFHDTLGIDRRTIARFLWMPAEAVVSASLRGLERGKVIVIPGILYKITASFLRHLPYSLLRGASSAASHLRKDRRV